MIEFARIEENATNLIDGYEKDIGNLEEQILNIQYAIEQVHKKVEEAKKVEGGKNILLKSGLLEEEEVFQIISSRIEKILKSFNDLNILGDPLLIKICDTDLDSRTKNALSFEGIETFADLVEKTEYEIGKVPNLGKKSLKEIQKLLSEYNLVLKV